MPKPKRKPAKRTKRADREARPRDYAGLVRDSKRIAAANGLRLTVAEYGDSVDRTDVWYLFRKGREVGHWVPATERYRIGNEYGGPLAFALVCERLAGTQSGNALRKSA